MNKALSSDFESTEISMDSNSDMSSMKSLDDGREEMMENKGKIRANWKVIFGVSLFFCLVLSIIALMVGYKLGSFKTDLEETREEVERTTRKLFWFKNKTDESGVVETNRDINYFAGHPSLFGVEVFPYDEELEEGRYLYECSCDLTEMEDYVIETNNLEEEDYDRRGITSSTHSSQRRNAFVFSRLIYGAISLLIAYIGSRVFHVHIYADSRSEAEQKARVFISSKIMENVEETLEEGEEETTSDAAQKKKGMWNRIKQSVEAIKVKCGLKDFKGIFNSYECKGECYMVDHDTVKKERVQFLKVYCVGFIDNEVPEEDKGKITSTGILSFFFDGWEKLKAQLEENAFSSLEGQCIYHGEDLELDEVGLSRKSVDCERDRRELFTFKSREEYYIARMKTKERIYGQKGEDNFAGYKGPFRGTDKRFCRDDRYLDYLSNHREDYEAYQAEYK